MALLDRLLPAWRHRDPEVRAAAMRDLGDEARDVLATVARGDADARVRRIAVKKIDDPDLLLEIGRADPDEDLRSLATGRAEELLVQRAMAAGPLEDCMRALATLTRPSHRLTVATRAAHPGVRRAALDGIADERSLAEVARRGDDTELGLAALARIGDVGLLRERTGDHHRSRDRDDHNATKLKAGHRKSSSSRLGTESERKATRNPRGQD